MNSLPSSSNSSVAFDLLAPPVRRWIWDKGWAGMRDIQERSILAVLNTDKDLIISAPTAGGKTEAAFLPLISSILMNPGDQGFEILYVAPLRALVNDQFDRLEDLGEQAELPVYPWHGDIAQGVKTRARRNPRGILLTTPESLEAMFVLRGLEIPTLFGSTRAVIIDELHSFLDNERGIHLRSLLSRLELAVGRRIRRLGLSATLSEMALVKEYLRPEAPESVDLLESTSEGMDLRLQLRGYISGADDKEGTSANRAVANHLFDNLRGSTNLVFAGSRQNVEWYADTLRDISESAKVPLEFLPHHANLSREHRLDLEKRLKTSPTTAICTSTLELGIDIGNIDCVAQIGAPFSVSSLRQRLGRSGRRPGQPAVLRMYSLEREATAESHPLDHLHLGLIRSTAMVELLIERWCEPPASQALHLSTLIHQVLSVIAEHGGVSAKQAYDTLCIHGPFRCVDPSLFSRVLRQIGSPDVQLIEQAPDGNLLLGTVGEKLVEHYSFYAVFQTPEEFRVVANGRLLGTLPVLNVVAPGMSIIFSGKRWRITEVDSEGKVIEVTEDRVGRTPAFGGGGGLIHDRITEKMREVLSAQYIPSYLDRTAVGLLEKARTEFKRLGLNRRTICVVGHRSCVLATWTGTVKTSTLAMYLRSKGFTVTTYDGLIEVTNLNELESLEKALEEAAEIEDVQSTGFLEGLNTIMTEKYHAYLSPDLLFEEAIRCRVDLSALKDIRGKFTM